MTRARPSTPAMRPARSEALPRVGDTVWTVDWVSLTGRAPVARTRARFLASVCPPTPVIDVVPEVMPVWQTTSLTPEPSTATGPSEYLMDWALSVRTTWALLSSALGDTVVVA